MRLSLCSEVLRTLPFAEQCSFAAAVGYDGLEIAPMTVTDDPRALTASDVAALRRTVAEAGLVVTGLHFLMLAPAGLSLTATDDETVALTRAVMLRLVDLCAELGGDVLVHGSPAQRRLPGDAAAAAAAREIAKAHFAAVGERARRHGVTYCIEPLSRDQTNFINTVEEAVAILDELGEPGLATMIDTSSAGRSEDVSVPDLIDRWLPTGRIAHIQVNATNRQGPGQGDEPFAPVFARLAQHGYDRTVAVEPFDYRPDGPASAARAAGYVRGLMEALAWRR